jgi:hypothetical protein
MSGPAFLPHRQQWRAHQSSILILSSSLNSGGLGILCHCTVEITDKISFAVPSNTCYLKDFCLFPLSEKHFVLMDTDILEAYLKEVSSFFYIVSNRSAIFVIVLILKFERSLCQSSLDIVIRTASTMMRGHVTLCVCTLKQDVLQEFIENVKNLIFQKACLTQRFF